LIERLQLVGEVVVLGAHEVAGEFDAVGGFEFPLLAVKGAVVAELLGEQVGSERGGERSGVNLVFAPMVEQLDDF
jgi:hypothetical protein